MTRSDLTDESVYSEDRTERLMRALETTHGVSRRRLLQMAAAGAPLLAGLGRATGPARAQTAAPAPATPIVKALPPEWFAKLGSNAEMRWDAARDLGYTIPNERFFVRNHTSTPLIDASTWRLQLFGTGLRRGAGPERTVEFSLEDLHRLPARTITSFIECAGNGRSYFASQQGTPTPGSQWHLGAIGVARWRGVPLSEVLDRAGIRRHAVDVLPEGLDATVISGGVDVGHVRRPLPVRKALDDVLLAYEMNGKPLPPDHGFPVRLVVPQWIGVANIKWLGRIEVADRPLVSPFSTSMYRLTGPTYPADQPPLTRQVIKSAFEHAEGAQFTAGSTHVLTGRSWSGHGAIRKVEISLDGGATWRRAKLRGPSHRTGWVRWSTHWRPTERGLRELQARATDATGRRQPATVPFNDGGYAFGAVVKHPVRVI
jgi:DMSO/TMAO reductase YedYZ molybdopterin-dependent catalytic subunit